MVRGGDAQIAGEVVEVGIERRIESAFSQVVVGPVQSGAAEVARVIFSRRTAEQAGVEEAFEAGAPIDEVALGELNGGNDDAAAADLAFDKQAAGVRQRGCAGSQVEFDAGPGGGGMERHARDSLAWRSSSWC